MSAENILCELIDRIATLPGKDVFINTNELSRWPDAEVAALKKYDLIQKARPATSVMCHGCEEQCVRPVHTICDDSANPTLFLLCEKRDDINRVAVSIDHVEQWQTSANLLVVLIAELLGLRKNGGSQISTNKWQIGMLKGKKHSDHLLLVADIQLRLHFAGHSLALVDILTIENDQLMIDKRTIMRLVDAPIGNSGDKESTEQRCKRLKKRVQEEKVKGNQAFLKTVAEEEGVSTTRIKQLLKKKKPNSKSLKFDYQLSRDSLA